MIYPTLLNTPIKEIIFSISYEGIIGGDCIKNYINSENISSRFNEINPASILEFSDKGIKETKDLSIYSFKNKKEVLNLKKGSFSYHFLNEYKHFDDVLKEILNFWNEFMLVSENEIIISSVSVRYINLIEIDVENPPSRLVQIYPKYSSDRDIINFQNSVQFSYKNSPEYNIVVVSTQPKKDKLLLDITVNNKVDNNKNILDLGTLFSPLQEIKNKVFFDSITAQALLKYINKNGK